MIDDKNNKGYKMMDGEISPSELNMIISHQEMDERFDQLQRQFTKDMFFS